MVSKVSLPLKADQEKTLQAIVAAQQAAHLAASGQASGGQSGGGQGTGGQSGRGQRAAERGNGTGGGERRGGGGAGGRGNALQEKLVAALNPEQQQAAWKKYQRDQIICTRRVPGPSSGAGRGRLRAYSRTGNPPTGAVSDLRSQMKDLKTAAGPGNEPEAAKVKEVETHHLTALIKTLDPTQRKALLESKKSTQTASAR